MSLRAATAGTMRALLLAAATGGAAFGLLVVFHPFTVPSQAPVVIGTPEADALHGRIDAARDALRQTETAIAALPDQPTTTLSDAAGQLEAQIAAATERRDLAQRHARIIRDALKANADVGALAEIRDSVVVGQFLAQLSTLDATIGEQGARLKPNHPTMRGLAAQRTALLAQIRTEAKNIAAALESEAKLEAAQLDQLLSRRTEAPVPTDIGSPALTTLDAQAAAQRATLDALMDSYFGLRPSLTSPRSDPILSALSPLNLLVAAIAASVALAAQIGLALRRIRLRRQTDLARWHRDRDLEVAVPAAVAIEPAAAPALRRAS